MPSPTRVRAVVGSLNGNLSNNPSILSFAADVRRGKGGCFLVGPKNECGVAYAWDTMVYYLIACLDPCLLICLDPQSGSMDLTQYHLEHTVVLISVCDDGKGQKKDVTTDEAKVEANNNPQGANHVFGRVGSYGQGPLKFLVRAIEALKASTLRLPVVSGARADIQNLKDAICSAVDVMQAMASSICSLLSKATHGVSWNLQLRKTAAAESQNREGIMKWAGPIADSAAVEEVNSLVAELANASAKERACLDQCRDLLSTLAAMQVRMVSKLTKLVKPGDGL
ncbi:QWRF motif-containing protein 9 [Vitis vinifera]|uniref:QWRF motif-containing protein 9 n=1 Tax=Vitis vinifera TaxID=29760 RepID=A0A438DY56_VITVI|nr:QWRF motif-containing protein 9 [Vitis vinifera]